MDVQKKPAKENTYSTISLHQHCNRKPVSNLDSQCQELCQWLNDYMNQGSITYMRTDSVHLSETAVNGAVNEINKAYGRRFCQMSDNIKTKSSGAHRKLTRPFSPTDFSKFIKLLVKQTKKSLYQLIWKRAIASQMSDAQLERTTISINAPQQGTNSRLKERSLSLKGFLKVYLGIEVRG